MLAKPVDGDKFWQCDQEVWWIQFCSVLDPRMSVEGALVHGVMSPWQAGWPSCALSLSETSVIAALHGAPHLALPLETA